MQKILCQINDTSLNHVIYLKPQLQGDGCTQLPICILLIDGALLWATEADLRVEAPLAHRALLVHSQLACWEQSGRIPVALVRQPPAESQEAHLPTPTKFFPKWNAFVDAQLEHFPTDDYINLQREKRDTTRSHDWVG